MALVEAPGALHRDPGRSALERDVRGLDGPGQHRGVQDVGRRAGLAKQFAGALRLGDARLAEPDVDPAGEQVLLVPVTVAVTEQDERGGHASDLPAWRCPVRRWIACPIGTVTRGTTNTTGCAASTGGSRRCRRSARSRRPPGRRPRLRRERRRPPSSCATVWRRSDPTSRSWASRSSRSRVGRWRSAGHARDGVTFRLGGFETPTPGRAAAGGHPGVQRAAAVRRGGGRGLVAGCRTACSRAGCSSRGPATRSAGWPPGWRSTSDGPRTLHGVAAAGRPRRAVRRRRTAAEGPDPPQRPRRARARVPARPRPGVGGRLTARHVRAATALARRGRRGCGTRAGRCCAAAPGGGSAS